MRKCDTLTCDVDPIGALAPGVELCGVGLADALPGVLVAGPVLKAQDSRSVPRRQHNNVPPDQYSVVNLKGWLTSTYPQTVTVTD